MSQKLAHPTNPILRTPKQFRLIIAQLEAMKKDAAREKIAEIDELIAAIEASIVPKPKKPGTMRTSISRGKKTFELVAPPELRQLFFEADDRRTSDFARNR